MSIQKNVASQKVGFIMVDSTDFATPETGITVTGKVREDGGSSATLSNTISELGAGQYVVTLSQGETNNDLMQLRFTGSGCADQFFTFYPGEDISIISNVLSTLDGNVEDKLASILIDTTSILVDTATTLDTKIDSILSITASILIDTTSILVDTTTTLDNKIDSILSTVASILVDTGSTLDINIISIIDDTSKIHSTLDHATFGLDALETITSQTKSTIDAPITDFLTSIVDQTSQILVSVISTLDGPILSTLDRNQTDLDSILADTGTTLDNKIDSILTDTGTTLSNNILSIVDDTSKTLSTLDNATLGLDALETITSQTKSTIDGPVDSAITQNTTLISDVLSTIDDVVISDLSNIESIVVAQGTSGAADWSAKEQAQIRSALGISGAVSALENYGANSRLDNATYGLDAIETLISDTLSTIDGPITSDLSNIESILENAGVADWTAKEKAQIRSALGVSGVVSALESYGAISRLDNAVYGLDALETIISDVLSTLDDNVASELSAIHSTVDTIGGDSNNISSILEDTKSILSTTASILVDTNTTLSNNILSIVNDTSKILSTIDGPLVASIADAVADEPIEDHDIQGNWGWSIALMTYMGSDGPGIYIDSNAANTNTVVGTDGTGVNPVSTFAAARTLADALGLKIYYLEGNSDSTLAATHTDWEFIGIGSVLDNTVNLGSQDVSRSLFRNLTLEGTQGGSGRITARDCALQDPGAGDTTLHIFAERCGIVDRIQIDTSNDNVLDSCYSLVAGTSAPVIQATGAAGTISMRHYSGGIEFESLSASHNVSVEGFGQVIFNLNCNVNANVSLRMIGTITDNTAGMASLTQDALINMPKINAEADTAISDAALATATSTSDILSTLDDPILSTLDRNQTDLDLVLTDTSSTLDNKIDSILQDTQSLIVDNSDIKSAVDDIESNVSNVLSTLDDNVANSLSSILNDVTSILADTSTDGVELTASAVDDILDEVNTGAAHNVTNSLGKQIREASAVLVLESGTAQAGAAGTITLAAGSNSNNDFYNDLRIVVVGGAGVGQARVVHGYDGTTKIAVIAPDWIVTPNNTSEYQIQSQSNVHVHELASNAVQQILADSVPFDGADISAILSTMDDNVADKLASIVEDTSRILVDTSNLNDTKIPDTLSLSNINSQMDAALDTVIPATPTTGSINDILDRQEELIVKGTCSGIPTATEIVSDISITVNDQFNGRIMTFRKDTTTANLRGQQTDITGSTAATNTFTVTALTDAPVSGDVFDIT